MNGSKVFCSISVDNVPPEYEIDLMSLRQINTDSKGPGNFAKKLVEKLFPELFGPDNLRNSFSYNGGGPKKKLALDPVRKMVIHRYVLYFYPELSREVSYQNVVINTINEGLRRPDPAARKKPQKATEEPVVAPDFSASEMFADIALTQDILSDFRYWTWEHLVKNLLWTIKMIDKHF